MECLEVLLFLYVLVPCHEVGEEDGVGVEGIKGGETDDVREVLEFISAEEGEAFVGRGEVGRGGLGDRFTCTCGIAHCCIVLLLVVLRCCVLCLARVWERVAK